MKDRKRFLLVFAICWVVGLTGGYFLGVGSALLPAENVDYTYYFTENKTNNQVEPISKECGEKAESERKKEEEDDHFVIVLRNVDVTELPKRLMKCLIDKK